MRNIFALAFVLVPAALVSTAVAQPAQPAQPAQRPVIDWEKQKAEILEHYRTLVVLEYFRLLFLPTPCY